MLAMQANVPVHYEQRELQLYTDEDNSVYIVVHYTESTNIWNIWYDDSNNDFTDMTVINFKTNTTQAMHCY
jgi:hypothetical protein